MNSQSMISIIVPVYNCANYLPQCIESILAQTYTNLQIILIDDGSVDNSGKICDAYATKDKRIQVIHQTNAGVSVARNKGLDQSKGEYICFVDADDYIAPDMCSYLFDLIQTYSVPLSVCNYSEVHGAKVTPRRAVMEEGAYPTEQVLTKFIRQMSVWNKLFAKSLFRTLRFSSEISYGEDLEVVFELFLQARKIAYGVESKYYYVINPQSATHLWNPKHLNYLCVSNKIMTYAKNHHLPQLYRSEQTALFYHFTICFCNCLLINPLDEKSADLLRNYFRKHFFTFLCSTVKWDKKMFVLLACLNYSFAAWIYNLLFHKDRLMKNFMQSGK